MNIQKQREEFEQWWQEKYAPDDSQHWYSLERDDEHRWYSLERDDEHPDEYLMRLTCAGWEVWQDRQKEIDSLWLCECVRNESSTQPSKSQLLDWILSEDITIRFDSPMSWTRDDGSKYTSYWQVSSPTTMFATYSSKEETLKKAYDYWHYLETMI